MWRGLLEHPAGVAAFSTLILAVFALVQVGLEIWRAYDRMRVARIEIRGPSWLARRTLAETLFLAGTMASVFHWARKCGSSEKLDRVERQLLEVLRLGGVAGGRTADCAQRAFEAFLAYADRLNTLADVKFTGRSTMGSQYATRDDLAAAHEIASEALTHVRAAIGQLSQLSPRRPHEPSLPDADDVRFVREAEAPT